MNDKWIKSRATFCQTEADTIHFSLFLTNVSQSSQCTERGSEGGEPVSLSYPPIIVLFQKNGEENLLTFN